MLFHRLLLKQLVTMEVIQWTSLWNAFMDEFENEKNLLGGSLGDKAAEDLKQRIIEHVIYFQFSYLGTIMEISSSIYCWVWLLILLQHVFFSEYPCCFKVLLQDYCEETSRVIVSQHPGSTPPPPVFLYMCSCVAHMLLFAHTNLVFGNCFHGVIMPDLSFVMWTRTNLHECVSFQRFGFNQAWLN